MSLNQREVQQLALQFLNSAYYEGGDPEQLTIAQIKESVEALDSWFNTQIREINQALPEHTRRALNRKRKFILFEVVLQRVVQRG